MTMNADVKKMWLEALRSGAYAQTADHLKDPKGFCCLGVLCDLHAKETKKGHWESDEYVADCEECGSRSSETDLPHPVQDWAGLTGSIPSVDGISLSTMNDDGVPFADIAACIERGL